MGCVPSQRTIHGGIHRKCADYANQAAILFNSKLLSSIHSLNSTLSHAFATYLDVYNPLLFLIQNPAKYGNNKSSFFPINFKNFQICTTILLLLFIMIDQHSTVVHRKCA